jgi:hypothetical protein
MNVITLDEAKSLLGITVSTYDDAIELKIPIISSLVKRLTKNKFNLQIIGNLTSGSNKLTVAAVYAYTGIVYNPACSDVSLNDVLTCGQKIEGTGIPTGSYITDIDSFLYNSAPSISLSAAATASGSVTAMTGIPIDLQQIIAKGIQWMMDNDSTIIKDDSWVSRSMGSISVSRDNADSKIDTCGMPLWFVKAFPRFQSGY